MAWHPPEVVEEIGAAWATVSPNGFGVCRADVQPEGMHWVRFHSLPGSKRWPTDEAEFQTCVGRFNAVADAVAAAGTEFFLLTRSWSQGRSPRPRLREIEAADPDARFWRSVRGDPDDPDSGWFHLFASRHRWAPGAVDPMIRLTADDVAWEVGLLPTFGGWLLCPYDGGLDVYLSKEEERNRLKEKFAAWLSAYPGGL